MQGAVGEIKWHMASSGPAHCSLCLDSKPVLDHVDGEVMAMKRSRLATEMLP